MILMINIIWRKYAHYMLKIEHVCIDDIWIHTTAEIKKRKELSEIKVMIISGEQTWFLDLSV